MSFDRAMYDRPPGPRKESPGPERRQVRGHSSGALGESTRSSRHATPTMPGRPAERRPSTGRTQRRPSPGRTASRGSAGLRLGDRFSDVLTERPGRENGRSSPRGVPRPPDWAYETKAQQCAVNGHAKQPAKLGNSQKNDKDLRIAQLEAEVRARDAELARLRGASRTSATAARPSYEPPPHGAASQDLVMLGTGSSGYMMSTPRQGSGYYSPPRARDGAYRPPLAMSAWAPLHDQGSVSRSASSSTLHTPPHHQRVNSVTSLHPGAEAAAKQYVLLPPPKPQAAPAMANGLAPPAWVEPTTRSYGGSLDASGGSPRQSSAGGSVATVLPGSPRQYVHDAWTGQVVRHASGHLPFHHVQACDTLSGARHPSPCQVHRIPSCSGGHLVTR